MAKQTTLVLFKTDAVSKGLCGTVLSRYEEAGLKIRGIKMMQLDDELLTEHYAHIAERDFFPSLCEFMKATPVIALALEGEDAIAQVRDLLGPTDSTTAPKGTIRGDFGENSMTNICHASDSEENAAIELKRFFGDDPLFDY